MISNFEKKIKCKRRLIKCKRNLNYEFLGKYDLEH
jgi:hypothetical protein